MKFVQYSKYCLFRYSSLYLVIVEIKSTTFGMLVQRSANRTTQAEQNIDQGQGQGS